MLNNRNFNKQNNHVTASKQGTIGYCVARPGVVLLVTLMLLVVLSAMVYTVSSRVAAQHHRDQYIVDYQAARYGCDSAVKYALATLEVIDPQLVSRPNEPDFSDLFSLSQSEYNQLLDEWNLLGKQQDQSSLELAGVFGDINDPNSVGADITGPNEPALVVIRGPYGPPWPLVAEPAEFEIGSAKVRIEIEDENAKYPVCWALLDDKKVRREVEAGLETFCEWMGMGYEQIKSLKSQLKEIGEIKPFKLQFKSITKIERTKRTTRRRGSRRATTRSRRVKKTVAPASVHTADFARLFHSSLIDTESLARATIFSDERSESALKYMGMWASSRVNINTAPRHVLEAAFTFGGDQVEIAEEIIRRRRIQPFKDIGDLKKSLFRYSDSIAKCEKYITTVSTFFTIRVTASSGVAKASAVIAITKDGKKIQRIAVLSG